MDCLAHLSKDKKLRELIKIHGPIILKKRKNIHLELCASILAQQLSSKVATIIYNRFISLFESQNPSPSEILKVDIENLRAIGLSYSKANYIQNVSRFALEYGLEYKLLNRMSDEEVIQYLTKIKGVGRWTVEMQLIFSLGRTDVFSIDDIGLQNAIKKLYLLDDTDKQEFKRKIEVLANKWKPYRSFACLYLWKYRDTK